MAVNPLNMNGLATGIDTNSVVKSMLQNEQSRIDKALQSKQIITWKQELYREIIEQAKGLYQKYLSAASEKSLVLASKYSTYRINSTDVSVATATGGNKSINYELDVTSVASTAKKISNILSVSGNKATGSTTLSELGLVSDTSIYIKTNKGISESVTINQTDTISQLIDKINNIENIDIRANFSELTGRVSFETVETGESSKILISDELGNGINTLSFMGIDENEATGTNCNVSITTEDLQVINLNYETNAFTIDSIQYNISKIGKTTLSSTLDTNNTVENIKSFVNDYNELVSKINNLIRQKKSFDYNPLTKAQKEEMEDKEIEAWETKAKEGILRNDTQLNSILEALKNSIFKQVEGSNVNLNDFGISYPSDYSKRGQISLDENKLKNALINNSQDLIEYFTKKSTSSDINTNFNESGIINRIKDTFDRYTNKYNSVLVQKSGYKGSMNEFTNQFTKQMIEIERKVLLLEKKYSEKEKRLYMDFAKLESSMNQLNSQMTWLDSTINSE